jgi:hypothetical protein
MCGLVGSVWADKDFLTRLSFRWYGLIIKITITNYKSNFSAQTILKMPPKITVKKDYILVEPRAVDFWEIWECIGAAINLPEFPEKNDIWLFHDGPIKLSYVDLYRLKDFIQKYYPENASRNKTAIVVESGIQAAMATFFIQVADGLPFEIRVFTDFKLAEDWVKEH